MAPVYIRSVTVIADMYISRRRGLTAPLLIVHCIKQEIKQLMDTQYCWMMSSLL